MLNKKRIIAQKSGDSSYIATIDSGLTTVNIVGDMSVRNQGFFQDPMATLFYVCSSSAIPMTGSGVI